MNLFNTRRFWIYNSSSNEFTLVTSQEYVTYIFSEDYTDNIIITNIYEDDYSEIPFLYEVLYGTIDEKPTNPI